MAVEKPSRAPTTLDSLATLIADTAASADKKFTALAADIAELKTEMMDQFDHVDTQFRATDDRLRDIGAEIAVIHCRIERLEERATPASPKRSIIRSHASPRSKKHLGLDKKIAA